MIFSGALEPEQIRALYATVDLSAQEEQEQEESAAGADESEEIVGVASDEGLGAEALAEERSAGGHVFNASVGQACTLDVTAEFNLTFCAPGLVCAPLLPQQRSSSSSSSPAAAAEEADSGGSSAAKEGVCAAPPPGALLPREYPSAWPTPLALFPLTNASLAAWPPSGLAGWNSGASWQPDGRFGSVLACNAQAASHVELPAVPYAAGGGWAINLWAKMPPNASQGTGYEYLYSHAASRAPINFGPNQLHIYVPQGANPFEGVVRVLVKDGDDVYRCEN